MSDDRTLKPMFGQTHEEYSFRVVYKQGLDLYAMYVWAENIEEAKKEVKRRTSNVEIKEVKIEWPR